LLTNAFPQVPGVLIWVGVMIIYAILGLIVAIIAQR